MKFLLSILLLFPVVAIAQDSVITISPSMFDKNSDQFLIAATDGWIFKQGSDTNWAKKDIDVSGWKNLKPVDLSAKYADKNGKAECWFRIKIKPDSRLDNQPLGIKLSSWAAADVYIDGNCILTTGNTGSNGKPFKEYSPFGNPSYPVSLLPGKVYTIALHFVDYVSPVSPVRLKSEDIELVSLIRITGSRYNAVFLQNVKITTIYNSIWIFVSAILSLLFWLLFFQNPFEKNLRLIALGSTFLALAMFCGFSSQGNIGISYNAFTFYNFGFNLFIALTSIMTPVILVNIFKRRVAAPLKVFLFIFFIGIMISFFLFQNIAAPISFTLIVALFAVCIYYIISSWNKLKGAQWAIVVGLLLSIAWALVYVFIVLLFQIQTTFSFYLTVTCYSLSFPLSLLVYVSIRFKEIIKEVQQNAQQVVQLSEEKKEQAVNQQKILQQEVNRQTAEIRTALDNLKSTQSQLIQSEKMASLGELTAGIAHEIQNPLNFVNNFSEVNTELIQELKSELKAGNHEDAIAIANDIADNEQKINHHGKRADAIVKGMLQHSRTSASQKEPTDINQLADEYFRLAYHGLRAKDNFFNATLKTDYDETIGNINIIPQDIGRVILNLITNAFYAVTEKKKQSSNDYEPTVTIATSSIQPPSGGRSIQIKVADNGGGIPQKIADKIFQPFFTTKPTGQGTGLGLSLAYDIVKAHGGEIKVETKESEGTVFIIDLPIA